MEVVVRNLQLITFIPNKADAWSAVTGKVSAEILLKNLKRINKKYKLSTIFDDALFALRYLSEFERIISPTALDINLSDLDKELRLWIDSHIFSRTRPKKLSEFSDVKNYIIRNIKELISGRLSFKPLKRYIRDLSPTEFVDIWIRIIRPFNWLRVKQKIALEYEPIRFFFRDDELLPLVVTRQHWTRFHFWIPLDTSRFGKKYTILLDPLWNMPLIVSAALYYPNDFLAVLPSKAKWLAYAVIGDRGSEFINKLGNEFTEILVRGIKHPFARSAALFLLKYYYRPHVRTFKRVIYYIANLKRVPLSRLFESRKSFFDHVYAYNVGIDRLKDFLVGTAYGRVWDSRPSPVWFNKSLHPENDGY